MENFIQLTCGELSFKSLSSKSVKAFITLLALSCLFVVIGLNLKPHLISYPELSSVMKLSTDLNDKVELKEKLDVKDIIDKTMNYSYSDTRLGFYLENLSFFDSYSKLDAETKILTGLPRYLSKKAKSYVRAVLKLSEAHQVDPIWILSVMWTESNFDFSAKSWAGARGLMQIMPETRKFIYKVYRSKGKKLLVEKDNFNIDEYFPYKVKKMDKQSHVRKLMNIELGIIYLKSLLKTFNSHKYATVAYNMGPGWTRGRLRRKLPVGQKNQYLDKVRKAYKQIIRKI